MDWLDLLVVQGTLKSLLQHHGSEAWILLHLAFLMVQPSHPYMTTGKTIALTRQSFVGNWYNSEQGGGPYPGKPTASEGDSQPKGTYRLWGQNKNRAMMGKKTFGIYLHVQFQLNMSKQFLSYLSVHTHSWDLLAFTCSQQGQHGHTMNIH